MKNKIRSLIVVASALVISSTAFAQGGLPGQGNAASPPVDQGSFFQSVQGYFTSFNTNLDGTFGLERGSIWTGADSIQGADVPLANSLGVSYDAWKLISVESVTRNSGVAGTLVSEQLGLGLNFVVHDVKLTAYADAGYDLYSPGKSKFGDRVFGEVGLRVSKALSEHTFSGVGIGGQFPQNRQCFQIFAGFTF